MDFPAGILNIQTFRKLPTHAPKQKKKTWNISGKFRLSLLNSFQLPLGF